ncbi:AI-2E family transporter [Gryllotalpicola protaetiae]|uniref:AI-2E family transporter n=1 Tax=Gryllotalpicola protaetiae TaxID=2419771 RepID=A0A387BHI8_9MICO|nr:AI-2E family transporter [Gryllotalpicola protaetiae]AYG02118.1 AI-2E family transporter [Gryllotalpicola protaetiae]
MKIRNAFTLGLVGTLGVGLGYLILTSIVNLTTVITYIGAALFIALGLEPLIEFLAKRGVPRWASIVIVFVVILGVAVGVIWAIVPVIVQQSASLIQSVTNFVDEGTYQQWYQWLQGQFQPGVVDNAVSQVWHQLQANLGTITGGVLQVGLGLISGAFGVLIVLILTIYFAASLKNIKRGAYSLVPASKRRRFIDIAEQVTDSVGKYVIGQVSLALVNGILSSIFLTIIRAPYPMLLAVIAFVFSLVPLVGTLTGSALICLLCLLLGSPLTALVAAIYYLVYMQVEAYLLSPRIMNRAVSVPGALVVVAALAGGTLLGVLGALVAIPFAASVLLIVRQVVIPRQNEL